MLIYVYLHTHQSETSCVMLNVEALFSWCEFPLHMRFRPRDKKAVAGFLCLLKIRVFVSFISCAENASNDIAITTAHKVALILILPLVMCTIRLRCWWVMATSVAEYSQLLRLIVVFSSTLTSRLGASGSWRLNWYFMMNAQNVMSNAPPRRVLLSQPRNPIGSSEFLMKNCLHLECARHIDWLHHSENLFRIYHEERQ